MTDRVRLDDLTSDQLDQLHDQLDRARTALAELLDRFHPVPLPGYDGDRICHPITRQEYDRWRAALGETGTEETDSRD